MTRNGHKHRIVELLTDKPKGFDRSSDFWFSDDIGKWHHSGKSAINKAYYEKKKK